MSHMIMLNLPCKDAVELWKVMKQQQPGSELTQFLYKSVVAEEMR